MEDPLVTVQELAVSMALSGRNESSEDPRYSGSNLRKKKKNPRPRTISEGFVAY
jgi:hypothetical protein